MKRLLSLALATTFCATLAGSCQAQFDSGNPLKRLEDAVKTEAGRASDAVKGAHAMQPMSIDVVVAGHKLHPTDAGRFIKVPKWDTNYRIYLTNHTPKRLLAVVAIDGISVMDGNPLGDRKWGYVIAPHSTAVIDGWRVDQNLVTSFVFRSKEKSVADYHGMTGQMGTIEMAVYDEFRPEPIQKDSNNSRGLGSSFSLKGGETGTGSGDTEFSRTRETHFIPGRELSKVTLWYGLGVAENTTPKASIPKHLMPR